MSSGERDLRRLLMGMEPELMPGEYVFCCLAEAQDVPCLATVFEPEGVTYVVTKTFADEQGYAYDFVARWIMLTIHSALDAVGLTAAVSTALADAGMSCNVIAGFHHDHLLVPTEAASQAMSLLTGLAAQEAALPEPT